MQTRVMKMLRTCMDGFDKRAKVETNCCCETAAVALVEANTAFPALVSGE